MQKKFDDELHKPEICVHKKVKTVFRVDPQDTSEMIIAVPAGFDEEDEVLPGIELHPGLASQITSNGSPSWVDILFAVITSKCPAKFQESILEFRYGKEVARKMMIGAGAGIGTGVGVAGGVVVGATLGGVLGAIPGIIAGPPGVVIGAAVGTTIGTFVGATVVGTGAGAVIGYKVSKHYEQKEKKKIDEEKKKIDKEVYNIQHK